MHAQFTPDSLLGGHSPLNTSILSDCYAALPAAVGQLTVNASDLYKAGSRTAATPKL
jgi:hypothetical protein